MREIIKLQNLSYTVKDGIEEQVILKNIKASFKQSDIVTISGPSGSGKTTLLYAIAGLLEDLSGKLYIDGKDILSCSKEEKDYIRLNKINMVFQNLNLFSFMNVEDNILIPFYIKNKSVDKKVKDLMNQYLDVMNLGDIRNRNIQSLSGGEQQRVAIVRAILDSPKLILCDEPTASLDKKNTKIFMQTLESISRQSDATIIIVTHDQNVVQYGTSKFYMEDGILMKTK